MKTQLTPEQSRHLSKLGCKFPYNVAIQDDNGDFYIIVTLTDLLEILPKEIKVDNTIFNLNMDFWNDKVFVGVFPLIIKRNNELIDALYELLCWVIENNYLKFE